MTNRLLFGTLLLLVLGSCANDKTPAASDSDVDAARNFLRASLDNDFNKARDYMLTDSVNAQLLKVASDQRARMTREENRHYQEASIRIYDTRNLSDSSSVVIYDNSYKKTRDSLLVFRSAGKWLVDLKYSYLGNANK
ncbi:hypothetical protein [Flaviaesturariibacter terrae]